MQVKELWIYPVKSLAGQSLPAATLAPRGFVDDRRWMLIDETGRFISQREHAHLAHWQAGVVGDDLFLENKSTGAHLVIPAARANDGPPVQVVVWDDTFLARLVTSVSPAILSEALGLSCRLVYLSEDSHRPVDPRYAKPGEEVSFADGYPYLFTNTASLDLLNQRFGATLSMNRFRANVVVESPLPFEEDEWTQVDIGPATFRMTKPCARCVVVTIDPTTAEKDPNVFAALAAFRTQDRKVLFGVNACWAGQGHPVVRVGEVLVVK
jgi:uncharacterized protein